MSMSVQACPSIQDAGRAPRLGSRGPGDVSMHFSEPEAGLVSGEFVVGPGILAGLRRRTP
ncbi:hypothetical protein OV079_22650 [Nannocystis pusilla]|uniref:Uncharacterized protein n=1 Tax=Nannocystis pusilla TaxID=889268 RepID=A0A9X3IXC6_9BACT|nr:hypothetical protein [Nannocystis pusilla]MCY1008307.1 hypothetical protein [Nannocystis pusilla]